MGEVGAAYIIFIDIIIKCDVFYKAHESTHINR